MHTTQSTPTAEPTQRRWRQRLRGSLLALLLALPLFGPSCTGEVLPFLQHFKRPVSMVTAVRPSDGILYMYVANADIDRIAMVNVPQRTLLIDPDPATPGVMLIKTGRFPVDIAATPDQKRLYVLHGIEGNIGAIDLEKSTQVTDNGTPLRLPKGCPENRCWRSPSRLLLHEDTANKKLYGVVALPAESSIAIVNLTDGDAEFGKEVKKFTIQGLPHALIHDAPNNLVYVTNSKSLTTDVNATLLRKSTFVHAIDLSKLTLQNIQICESTLENGSLVTPPCGASGEGAVSSDGRFLYLLDQITGGIRIYDIKEKKPVSQGDQRLPGETIQAPNQAAFLSVQFLPQVSLTIKDSDGNDTTVTKAYAWASASDGYGYVIDPSTHTIVDTDQRGPSVQNLQMYVGEDSLGDPRDPIRSGLPTLQTNSAIDNDTGIEVFDGKTRTEEWALTYEGTLVTGLTGRFSDLSKGAFADASSRDLSQDGVKVGDILVLEDCKEGSGTPTDGGADGGTPDGTTTTSTACEVTITEIDRHRLTVDLDGQTLPTKSAWSYHIRAQKGTFLVVGSLSGILDERLKPGTKYTCDYFALTLSTPTEETPRETRIQFSAVSGQVDARALLGGLSNRIASAPSHTSCGTGSTCDLETCKEHPNCTNTKCVPGSEERTTQCSSDENCLDGTCTAQQRIWFLDPSSSRLYVVNPQTLRAENTIR